MATVNISFDALIEWEANRRLDKEGRTEVQKQHMLRLTKYNIMVEAFNMTTVALAAAVASVVFLSMSTAFVLGSAALFSRYLLDREFKRLPPPEERGPRFFDFFRFSDKLKWDPNRIVFDKDIVLWKNYAKA